MAFMGRGKASMKVPSLSWASYPAVCRSTRRTTSRYRTRIFWRTASSSACTGAGTQGDGVRQLLSLGAMLCPSAVLAWTAWVWSSSNGKEEVLAEQLLLFELLHWRGSVEGEFCPSRAEGLTSGDHASHRKRSGRCCPVDGQAAAPNGCKAHLDHFQGL